MENEHLIEESDFIKLGQELKKDYKFLDLVLKLEKEGKRRVIFDRESKEKYLTRYYYMNLRPFARIVIHQFHRSDVDGLHDHPWAFQQFILTGGYWETTQEGRFWREPGYHACRNSNFLHRIELDLKRAGEDVWTVFMMGPKEKEWGFIDSDGSWVPHMTYLEKRKNEGSNNG